MSSNSFYLLFENGPPQKQARWEKAILRPNGRMAHILGVRGLLYRHDPIRIRSGCLWCVSRHCDRFHTSWLICPCTGGVIVTQDFLNTLKLNGPENTKLLGTVTAIYDIGCFFGAVAAFSLGERLGRKKIHTPGHNSTSSF